MGNQYPSDDSKHGPDGIPILHGPISPAEELAETDRQRQKADREADNAFKERQVKSVEASNLLAGRSFWIAVVGMAIASIACGGTWYQGVMNHRSWVAASSTLEQMRTDSQNSSDQFQIQLNRYEATVRETHEIAKQALDQATQTGKLATDTHDLAVTADVQATATRDIATETAGEVKAMQTQLEFSQRAWIEVVDAKLTQPVHYEGQKVESEISLMFKNSGNIPAVHVSTASELMPYNFFVAAQEEVSKGNLANAFGALHDREIEMCNSAEAFSKMSALTSTIYPNAPPRGFVQGLRIDKMADTDYFYVPFQPDPHPRMYAMLIAIGCIDYQFGTSSAHHKTGFAYQVNDTRIPRERGSSGQAVRFGVDIPIENITLTPEPTTQDLIN